MPLIIGKMSAVRLFHIQVRTKLSHNIVNFLALSPKHAFIFLNLVLPLVSPASLHKDYYCMG